MGIIEKTKEALTPGKTTHTGEERTGTAGTGAGMTSTPGAAGYGVVGGETAGTTTGYGAAGYEGGTTYQTTTAAAQGDVAACDRETFTKVVDRPRIIEHKEYIKEHRPVEKEFVVETRFVGERELAEQRTADVLGTEERVVAEAQPKAPCE